MRGLACLLMFQTHCYDSWLTPASPPKPLLHVLATRRNLSRAAISCFWPESRSPWSRKSSCQKNLPPAQIARTTILRGAEIFGYGLLFRLQEYLVAWGWAPKSDLLRVDVLNTIGLSMMLMGIVCWLVLAGRICGETSTHIHVSLLSSLPPARLSSFPS